MNLERVIENWKASGIKINNGATIDDIVKVEKELQFEFPESFKSFYQKMNGFHDLEYDKNWFSIMSLERILKEYNRDTDHGFIPFCDYLINSHWIGFIRGKNGVYKSYEQENEIATSFNDAIQLILTGSDLLY